MQTDNTAQHEISGRHAAFFPSVVISIAEHKAREYEEKINREISVIHHLVDGRCCESFAKMEPDNEECRYTAKAVKEFVSRFA